ncbi:MAG: MBL fold metallo-hydrolase [Spirochaetales bacterium]|nr:MBL fold metallo-hydrolase [Spirochaetales bacterium]
MIERIIVGQLSTNSYIFRHEGLGSVIIDPGGNAQLIIDALEKSYSFPAMIICTHGHLDHTAAIDELIERYSNESTQVNIAIHEAEQRFFGKEAYNANLELFSQLGPGAEMLMNTIFNPVPEADILFKGGEQIEGSQLQIIHTPGHSPGSISIYDPESKIVFTGDCLFSDTHGRTDFIGGNHQDIIHSIEEKLFTLPDDTRVYPGHGPSSTIERIKKEFHKIF